MQNLLARLIHAREEDEKEKEKDKDADDLEDDDLDEDDDEDFDDDDDDWDDDDDDDEEEKEGEEEAGAERRRASRRGLGRAADAARVFVRRARSARALDGPPGSIPRARYAPATVMRAILSVGAAIALRGRRSLPTISMSRSMSRRFPAIVSSSTGWASSPFSIHSPAAPRE